MSDSPLPIPPKPPSRTPYDLWANARAVKEKLYMKAAHKSLDIPEDDDMQINSHVRNGVSWKEMLVAIIGIGILATTIPFGFRLMVERVREF